MLYDKLRIDIPKNDKKEISDLLKIKKNLEQELVLFLKGEIQNYSIKFNRLGLTESYSVDSNIEDIENLENLLQKIKKNYEAALNIILNQIDALKKDIEEFNTQFTFSEKIPKNMNTVKDLGEILENLNQAQQESQITKSYNEIFLKSFRNYFLKSIDFEDDLISIKKRLSVLSQYGKYTAFNMRYEQVVKDEQNFIKVINEITFDSLKYFDTNFINWKNNHKLKLNKLLNDINNFILKISNTDNNQQYCGIANTPHKKINLPTVTSPGKFCTTQLPVSNILETIEYLQGKIKGLQKNNLKETFLYNTPDLQNYLDPLGNYFETLNNIKNKIKTTGCNYEEFIGLENKIKSIEDSILEAKKFITSCDNYVVDQCENKEFITDSENYVVDQYDSDENDDGSDNDNEPLALLEELKEFDKMGINNKTIFVNWSNSNADSEYESDFSSEKGTDEEEKNPPNQNNDSNINIPEFQENSLKPICSKSIKNTDTIKKYGNPFKYLVSPIIYKSESERHKNISDDNVDYKQLNKKRWIVGKFYKICKLCKINKFVPKFVKEFFVSQFETTKKDIEL